jgi:protein-tyrosine-phosphatase
MKILVICTGNTCRSPMASGMLKEMLEEKGRSDIEVDSAGIFAFEDQSASENAISAAETNGFDLKDHKAKRLDKSLLSKADLVITMTNSHRDAILNFMPSMKSKIFTLNSFVGKEGDIIDPFGCSLEVYEQTLSEIKESLKLLIEKIDEK